jgi:hypothetical protein
MLVATPSQAADNSAAQVSKLLSEARVRAVQLNDDANELWLFTQVPPSASSASQISVETHTSALQRISADIGDMAVVLEKLDKARSKAAPWQKNAIDQIKPLVRELMDSTSAVAAYVQKNPEKIASEDYKDYAEANADRTEKLSTLISTFVDYGKAKDRLDRLSNKLDLPPVTK